ncbi:MAG: DUF3108 domain-containing protein [Acidobacteria bacterium]|nr:DUF3108 domain-containing protein [Acidobacteriota bacterium]
MKAKRFQDGEMTLVRFIPIALPLALATLLPLNINSQTSRTTGTKNSAIEAKKADERKILFEAGESLEYRVSWNGFLTAANVRLQVIERVDFHGNPAWHFQAATHTVDPVRMLYPLDDQFDSYSDGSDLSSRQFELYTNEKNKHETRIIRMSTDGEPAQDGQATVRVLPGTHDPLGLLYLLRSVDWKKTNQIQAPVYDGKKLYEVKARILQEKADATVPSGNYSTTRIQLIIYERGRELTETKIWAWLANDEKRTPVLIEASLPFGDLRVELTKK